MTSIQPELWVEHPREALAFYEAAFGAAVVHCVGEDDDIVAQLQVDAAAFWVAPAASEMKRLSPRTIGGRRAGPCSWWKTRMPSSGEQRPQAQARFPRSPTSTDGGWAGSSTPSGTSGRSAHHSVPGHHQAKGSLVWASVPE